MKRCTSTLLLAILLIVQLPLAAQAGELPRTTDGTVGPANRAVPEWLGYPFAFSFRAPVPELDAYQLFPPVMADGVAVIAGRTAADLSQFAVIGMDTATGRIRWTWHAPAKQEVNPPTISEGKVYMTTAAGTSVAVDLQSGKFLWESDRPTVTLAASVKIPDLLGARVARAGQVMVAGSFVHGVVHAFSAETGKHLWSFDGTEYGGLLDGVETLPGIVFMKGVGFNKTYYHAIDSSGKRLWTHTINAFSAGKMTAAGDTLYVVHTKDKVLALNAVSGEVRWEQTISGVEELGWATAGDGYL